MPHDLKYGTVTLEKQRNITDDEPVIVFRAQDEFLLPVLHYYKLVCERNGSPLRHTQIIDRNIDTVERWQQTHATKIPTSDGVEP